MNKTILAEKPIVYQTHSPHNIVVKEIFPVIGMTCASCAISVESTLKSLPGVQQANVNFANSDVLIAFDSNAVSPEFFQEKLQAIGYDLVIDTKNKETLKEEAQRHLYKAIKYRTIGASALSLPVVLIGMFFMHMPYANWVMMILSTPVLFYFGKSFFANAFKLARHGKANMDTLVAISTGSAWLFSVFNTMFPGYWVNRGLQPHVYFEAAAVVIVFISVGKLLEETAKSKTSSAIQKLMGLQIKTVHLIRGNDQMDIPIQDVKISDILLVKPGEKIPVDGGVTYGSSYVEESTITGEPLPVKKVAGSLVFAGTINQKGSFHFIAEKLGADTILGQIIEMVQAAQGSKAPVQKLVDKIAGIFVPVVIAISILTFVIWLFAGGPNAFSHGLMSAITVLVIACPCALGLATPTAIMVGVGKGAESNILIKDAESLEIARKVNAIVLDKTGTITEGKPSVTNMVFDENVKADEFKQVLMAIEMQSEHPLAGAIVSHLKNSGFSPVQIEQFESITGKGVAANYQNRRFLVGNIGLMNETGVIINSGLNKQLDILQKEGKTIVYFAKNKVVIAFLAIADPVKPGSKPAIQALNDQHIDVYMVTGDHLNTAEVVARQVGMVNIRAEVLPGGKADFVKSLQQSGKIVAMVGDGINDSHAMVQADLSIAMGKGSDIAMDVAQMTIIGSDLRNISGAIKLSRDTFRTIRQNLFWAFIYNVICIPLAAGILYPVNGFLLNPMIAGAAMALSSVSVVGNSLRLKYSGSVLKLYNK